MIIILPGNRHNKILYSILFFLSHQWCTPPIAVFIYPLTPKALGMLVSGAQWGRGRENLHHCHTFPDTPAWETAPKNFSTDVPVRWDQLAFLPPVLIEPFLTAVCVQTLPGWGIEWIFCPWGALRVKYSLH